LNQAGLWWIFYHAEGEVKTLYFKEGIRWKYVFWKRYQYDVNLWRLSIFHQVVHEEI
jgi:hypothetical protein